MESYTQLKQQLEDSPKTWLVTGAAGFIGSNLVETLLSLKQRVVGLDNFSTGHVLNLDEVKNSIHEADWQNFQFVHGDIRDLDTCRLVCDGVDYVLHQAALGSVPRSILDPITTNQTNIDGFLNMLVASRDAQVKSFTYAASSSTYGDHPGLPKVEQFIGKPLSPYAITKYVNELYSEVFALRNGFKAIGLRYFNVFGERQDPDGPYAAVIPKWMSAMLNNEDIHINGDGETTRDFCYIENAIQANLLAASTSNDNAKNEVYNIAVGERISLNELFNSLVSIFAELGIEYLKQPIYRDFRDGDVRHSLADISKAQSLLGYQSSHRVVEGLRKTIRAQLNRRVDFEVVRSSMT